MPELPEVETIKNDLIRAGLCGLTVKDADIFWHRTLSCPSAGEFKKQISGAKITGLSRRGKYLIFELLASRPESRGTIKKNGLFFLIWHLRMSGRIDLKEESFAPRPHDRARLVFRDGTQLLFHDTRKFGRWYFVGDIKKVVGKLGAEPLEPHFTAEWLAQKLKTKKRMLKPLLLDQTLIAGIGNIYADEALWYARLHPKTNSAHLSEVQIKALHAGIVKAIKVGIKNAGTSMGVGKANFYSVGGRRGNNQEKLKVFRRTGEPCPRCHARIERIVVGQRSTHLCPHCQKRSK